MALAFINDSFTVNGSGGTTTGTRPTSVGSGNLLLAKWDIYDTDATASSLPSGWTSILNNYHSTGQGNVTTKIAWADGAAGVAFAGPAQYTNLYLMGYSGQLSATPIDSGSGAPTWNLGQSSTCTGTGVTVTDNGSILIFMMTGYGDGLSSGPSGMTPRESNYDGVNNVYELAVNSGATGNKTATLSASDSWGVGMIVIRPAGAGGSNTPKTITAGQSQTLSAARKLGLARSAAESQTLLRMVAIARSITGGPQLQTLGRSLTVVPATIARTAAQAPTRGAQAVGKPASAATAQAPTFGARGVSLPRTATETAAPAATKALPRSSSATQVQLGAITKGQGFFRNFAAGIAQAASRLLAVGLPRSSGHAAAPTVAARGVGRLLARSASQALQLARGVARGISASSGQAGSAQTQQSGGGSHAVGANAVQLQSPLSRLAVARLLGLVATGAPAAAKALPRATTAAAAQSPSRSRQAGLPRAATAAQAPARGAAQLGRPLAAAATGSPAARRAAAVRLPMAGQAATPSRGIGHYLTLLAATGQVAGASWANATLFVGRVVSSMAARLFGSSLSPRSRPTSSVSPK